MQWTGTSVFKNTLMETCAWPRLINTTTRCKHSQVYVNLKELSLLYGHFKTCTQRKFCLTTNFGRKCAQNLSISLRRQFHPNLQANSTQKALWQPTQKIHSMIPPQLSSFVTVGTYTMVIWLPVIAVNANMNCSISVVLV